MARGFFPQECAPYKSFFKLNAWFLNVIYCTLYQKPVLLRQCNMLIVNVKGWLK